MKEMKEIIKKKMDEHIEKIIEKEEISNEDYYLLNLVYQKIEGEEKLAEMEARNKEEREKNKQKYQELREILSKDLLSFD